jgi:hypothetical protein
MTSAIAGDWEWSEWSKKGRARVLEDVKAVRSGTTQKLEANRTKCTEKEIETPLRQFRRFERRSSLALGHYETNRLRPKVVRPPPRIVPLGITVTHGQVT